MKFHFLFLLLGALPSLAQTTAVVANPDWAAFEHKSFIYNEKTMPYRLLLPQNYDATKAYPLLVFLHGAGERGTDNEITLTHIAPILLQSENRDKYEAIVLVPQCATEYRWVETDWKLAAHNMPEMPSVPMSQLLALLDELDQNYKIDASRRYVVGLSMGGFGTWDILMRKPDYFAAGAPVCGGADNSKADLLKNIPIWAFHGEKDKVVIPARSRDMVAAVKKSGGTNIRYTEYKDVGHGSWKPAFADPELWKWLFEQRL